MKVDRLSIATALMLFGCEPDNQIGANDPDASLAADASTLSDSSTQTQPWTLVTSVTTTDLYGVTGTGPTDVISVGGTPGETAGDPGVAVRWNGASWSVTDNLINLFAMSGATAVGEYGGEGSATEWNGSTWSSREVLAAGILRGTVQSGFGTYVVGDNGLLMFKSDIAPGGWRILTSNTTSALHAVWGSSSSDLYVVGAGGVILHNTTAGVDGGGTWTKTIQGSSTLTGVWGSSANDVYVVGAAPAVILHSTNGGATWTSIAPPEPAVGLFAVGGRSATDVYAVGATGGVIFHSSGNDVWTSEASPTTKDLFGVWVADTGDAYAVGRRGTILHKLP